MAAPHTQPAPTKVTLGLVLAWIFGVIFTIAGAAGTLTGDIGFGLPLLLAGLVLLPIVRDIVRARWSFELSTGLLAAILIVLLVISIANTPSDTPAPTGRGDSLTPATNHRCPTGETARSAAECPRVLGLGDRVDAEGFAWTFTDARRAEYVGKYFGETLMGQEADGVYLIVDVTVENTGTSARYLSGDMVKLVDDRGREFSPDTTAAFYLEGKGLTFDEINPGIAKRGSLVYDLPADVRVARVKISDGLFSSDTYYVSLIG